MIVHSYGGKLFTSGAVQRIRGIEGWFVVGKVSYDRKSFNIVAKETHGGGFASRDRARDALKELKATQQVNFI